MVHSCPCLAVSGSDGDCGHLYPVRAAQEVDFCNYEGIFAFVSTGLEMAAGNQPDALGSLPGHLCIAVTSREAASSCFLKNRC